MFTVLDLFNDASEALAQPAPRVGDICPQCGLGRLAYNGTLHLACPKCGYALAEGGGCS